MKKDDAVSPVVAFMLILTILVSVIALLNSTYIPGLKQQAEIEHIRSVEQSFGELSSDIDRMITFGQSGSVTERIQMGGGDVLFSPLRSSGTLRVNNTSPDWVLELVAVNSTYSSTIRVSLATISYKPVGNFWQDQGYSWQNGIINVTKSSRTTWLEQNTQAEADESSSNFLSGLIRIDDITINGTNISHIRISVINMSAQSDKQFASNNGFERITLNHEEETPTGLESCTNIQISVNQGYLNYAKILKKYQDMFKSSLSIDENCTIKDIDTKKHAFFDRIQTKTCGIDIPETVASTR